MHLIIFSEESLPTRVHREVHRDMVTTGTKDPASCISRVKSP